jgi:hypothetical protein
MEKLKDEKIGKALQRIIDREQAEEEAARIESEFLARLFCVAFCVACFIALALYLIICRKG